MISKTIRKKISLFLKNQTFEQAVKYILTGISCTIVDMLILYLLTKYLSLYYITSAIFSFIVAVIMNYIMSIYWVFKIRIIENRTLELFYYIIISVVGLLISIGSIWFLTEYFDVHFMVSKFFSLFITFGWNFWIRKKFLHT
ncbi:MAG: GtrA family protein [Chitinophagaceae bacterium]|nr:GtrA family protein [Chitinophagaceae bacterium]